MCTKHMGGEESFLFVMKRLKKQKNKKIEQATAPPKQKTTAATTKWSFKMEKQSTEQQKWRNHEPLHSHNKLCMAGELICGTLTFAAFADKRNSKRVSSYKLTSSPYLFRQIIVNTFILKWTTIPYSRPLGSPSNANVLHKQPFRHNTSLSLETSFHSKRHMLTRPFYWLSF